MVHHLLLLISTARAQEHRDYLAGINVVEAAAKIMKANAIIISKNRNLLDGSGFFGNFCNTNHPNNGLDTQPMIYQTTSDLFFSLTASPPRTAANITHKIKTTSNNEYAGSNIAHTPPDSLN